MNKYESDLNSLKSILISLHREKDVSILCSYYPFGLNSNTDNIYDPKCFTSQNVKPVTDFLANKIKNKITCNVTEYHYNGCEKIVYRGDNISDTYHIKKISHLYILSNSFAIVSYITQIDERTFPKLKIYDEQNTFVQIIYQHTLFDATIKKYDNDVNHVFFSFNCDDIKSLDNSIKNIINVKILSCMQ